MAYRIRNFDNFSVERVNEIFRRGRSLDHDGSAGSAPAEAAPASEDEDFTSNPTAHDSPSTIIPMTPVEMVDEELESVR